MTQPQPPAVDSGLPATGFGCPRSGVQREDCLFYTHVEIAGELVPGNWDLRGCVDDYLGRIDYRDRSVLEIGPASGYLTFAMEARGAQVTCVELGRDYIGDPVLHVGTDPEQMSEQRQQTIERVLNSFWYGHERNQSKARVYYGDARQLPAELGDFDIGLLGAVLLHSRDPLGILQAVCQRCRTIVFTDAWKPWMDEAQGPQARLVPSARNRNAHTWWEFSPEMMRQALGIFGFAVSTTLRSEAHRKGDSAAAYPLYTLVAQRQ